MKSKKLAKLIILPFIIFSSLLFPIQQQTFARDTICDNYNISEEIRKASGCDNDTKEQLPQTVKNILNAIIGVSGLISVIFVIVGGISYMSSSGDSNKIKKAKDTILYACIGLAVCVLAFAIVNFVISDIIYSAKL